jgi:hypothetical protein
VSRYRTVIVHRPTRKVTAVDSPENRIPNENLNSRSRKVFAILDTETMFIYDHYVFAHDLKVARKRACKANRGNMDAMQYVWWDTWLGPVSLARGVTL